MREWPGNPRLLILALAFPLFPFKFQRPRAQPELCLRRDKCSIDLWPPHLPFTCVSFLSSSSCLMLVWRLCQSIEHNKFWPKSERELTCKWQGRSCPLFPQQRSHCLSQLHKVGRGQLTSYWDVYLLLVVLTPGRLIRPSETGNAHLQLLDTRVIIRSLSGTTSTR